ncbi:MAG: type I phosphomannose isomerase catalytic subunit [Planctomycetota bacterium]
MNPYPLIFEPSFKPRIWGGRRLESVVGKRLPATGSIGESWELSDLESDPSRVANGPARGKTLGEMVQLWGADLLGRAALVEGRFPLLIKFLDAAETLSVQVHPDAAVASASGGRVRIKNEAWYVVWADPGAFILRGVREGTTKEALRAAVESGNVEGVLQRIPVRKGLAYYLPSGTVHALGAGAVVAEVQTPSDVTYRLHDWSRVDPSTGRPRELHIEEGLACASLEPVATKAEKPEHVASLWTAITGLVRCESFVIERCRMVEGLDIEIPYAEMVVWIVLEGRGSIVVAGHEEAFGFGVGDVVLLPAGLRGGRVRTERPCMWLEVAVPVRSSLSDFDRPSRAARSGPAETKLVPLNVPRRERGGEGAGPRGEC